jgi:hypothetical protein
MKTTMILENEFIEQLFLTNTDNDVKKDFYDFLLYEFAGYNLICDFKNKEDYIKAVEENPIWELILDKIDDIRLNASLKKDILTNDFYKPIGEHNIFLTTYTEKECIDLSKDNGYIYISNKNIENVWSDLTKDKRNNIFKVTNDVIIPDEYKFNSWSKLDNFSKPLTSILIFDKYILNDISQQKLSHNLLPLLDRLLQNVKKDNEVTVSIVSVPKDWCIEKRQKRLNAFFISKGFKNIKINIIKYFKVFKPTKSDGLHGRVIFTNYYHIRSDDSFNYFNGRNINNDADIKINFSLSSMNKCFYEKELKDIKNYISKLSNDPDNPKEEYKTLYFPNKRNNLLN